MLNSVNQFLLDALKDTTKLNERILKEILEKEIANFKNIKNLNAEDVERKMIIKLMNKANRGKSIR